MVVVPSRHCNLLVRHSGVHEMVLRTAAPSRRREGGVRNPVKSTGPMQCGVHGREYAHSISNPQADEGIYVLKPETQRPLEERRHRYRSPSPPLVA